MKDCLFCQIVAKKVMAEIILEGKQAIIIKDKYPKAPIHLLVLPRKHYSIPTQAPQEVLKEMIDLAHQAAVTQNIAASGYRLSFNVGRDAGQEIEHIHLHIMGGGASQALF